LFAALGLFVAGTAVSITHGIHQLVDPSRPTISSCQPAGAVRDAHGTGRRGLHPEPVRTRRGIARPLIRGRPEQITRWRW